ncbi:hypothetical protein AVEN_9936-1, partial [Araneus ventricosus]
MKTTPQSAPPLQASAPHHRKDIRPFDLTYNMPKYTTDLQWYRVSNLGPYGPEADTLTLGHSGP